LNASIVLLAVVAAPNQQLIIAGADAFRAGEHEEALVAFTKAFEALPDNSSLLWNIGRCLEELGRTDEALESFERYLELEFKDRRHIREALGKVAKLRAAKAPRSATLRVETSPPKARVFIDGEPAGRSPVLADLPAGRHQVVARLEGHVDRHTEIVANAGRPVLVSLALSPQPKAATLGEAPGRDQPPLRRWLVPAAVGAAGVVLTALSVRAFLDRGEHEDAAATARRRGGAGELTPELAEARGQDADERAEFHGALGWALAAGAAGSLGWTSWIVLR